MHATQPSVLIPPTITGTSESDLIEYAEKACTWAENHGRIGTARVLRHCLVELLNSENPQPLIQTLQFKRLPITIDEFVESSKFLGDIANVWPSLMDDLRAINPNILLGEEPIHEAYLGGATGIGKSMVARITLLYQVYLLTCLRDPQRLYGLEPNTCFVFPLQSASPDVTRRILYEPIREMFEAMPYAQKYLTWNQRRTTTLEINGGIHVVPLVAKIESLLGQAIPGAILDEVNFMQIVEQSKKTQGPRGLGGRYDQAEEVYREISQRRKSRFGKQGISIGTIVLCSSARYPNDFLDRRIREAKQAEGKNIITTRHKRYDVAPPDRYSGETFPLLVGTERYRTRILNDDEDIPEGASIEHVPVEYLRDFQRDPEFALRQIVGIATDNLTPFIEDREKIIEAIEKGEELELDPWVDNPNALLERDGFPRWLEDAIPGDKEALRFVHIDLSRTRDACGIAVIKFLGIAETTSLDDSGAVLLKPSFAVEAAISIKPSPDCELIYSELRSWLLQIVNRHKVTIYSISLDGFQSTDSQQIFRRLGIRSQELSVDRTPEPYEYLRECLYEGRLVMVENETLQRELLQLERNPETGKVDHPPRGSKDIADAVCGAIFSASKSRRLRNLTRYVDNKGNEINVRPQSKRPQGRLRPQGRRRL